MSQSDPAASAELRSPLFDGIVRHRNTLWGILIVIYALAFTGQWRVGRDSALYRGLAHSLATGKGYKFGDFGSHQILPGFPVVLAGFEKIFGLAAWPGIVFVHLTALGALVLTYKLVRLHFPQWLAVLVTFCVGLNGWFLELSNEMLADMPFIFAMLLALFGWELLVTGPRTKRAIAYVVIGLALAALLRPTFLVLAVAWGLVCVRGLIVGPNRKLYAALFGILMIVALAAAAADPRVRGFKPFSGGYERDAVKSLGAAKARVVKNLPELLQAEMTYSFFGQKWLPWMTELMVLAVLGSSLLLWRVNPLWTLLVWVLIAVTLVMTVVPRYYVMILPLLMLGWFLLIIALAKRVPPKHFEGMLVLGIAAVVIPNLARDIKVIGQQHGWRDKGAQPAKWQYVLDMSEEVRQYVKPGEKVIAPGATIMAYMSGRDCVNQRDIIDTKKPMKHWPRHMAALNIKYAVYPSLLYEGPERIVRELMDKGVIVPVERVAKRGEAALFRVEIHVPPETEDWRKKAIATQSVRAHTSAQGTTRPSAKVLQARKRKQAAARRELAAHKALVKARIEKQERLERKERQEAADRAAAKVRKARLERKRKMQTTQPASAPVTQPTSSLFDVGGFAGQSVASFSDSISSRLNFREPALMPWQRLPASSQFSRLASTPSQNGHVRHCSGLASYTPQTRFTCPTPSGPLTLTLFRNTQSYSPCGERTS